jgi:hypothetical protein
MIAAIKEKLALLTPVQAAAVAGTFVVSLIAAAALTYAFLWWNKRTKRGPRGRDRTAGLEVFGREDA